MIENDSKVISILLKTVSVISVIITEHRQMNILLVFIKLK